MSGAGSSRLETDKRSAARVQSRRARRLESEPYTVGVKSAVSSAKGGVEISHAKSAECVDPALTIVLFTVY